MLSCGDPEVTAVAGLGGTVVGWQWDTFCSTFQRWHMRTSPHCELCTGARLIAWAGEDSSSVLTSTIADLAEYTSIPLTSLLGFVFSASDSEILLVHDTQTCLDMPCLLVLEPKAFGIRVSQKCSKPVSGPKSRLPKCCECAAGCCEPLIR
jgi:hypothetical protein